MAVKTVKTQTVMLIEYKVGADAKGSDIIKGQRFAKVKVSAADGDILEVGNAIASLLMYPLQKVIRQDQNAVMNE